MAAVEQPPPAVRQVDRHPILGAISGLVFGIGLALLLISFAVIALGTMTPYVIMVLGLVLGLVLALALPARGGRTMNVDTMPGRLDPDWDPETGQRRMPPDVALPPVVVGPAPDLDRPSPAPPSAPPSETPGDGGDEPPPPPGPPGPPMR